MDGGSLEAHLFEFDGDLYGEWVRIEWVERLRDIERFASVEQLKAAVASSDRHPGPGGPRRAPSTPSRVSHA